MTCEWCVTRDKLKAERDAAEESARQMQERLQRVVDGSVALKAENARLRAQRDQAYEVIQQHVDRWLRESHAAQRSWTLPAADAEMSNLDDYIRKQALAATDQPKENPTMTPIKVSIDRARSILSEATGHIDSGDEELFVSKERGISIDLNEVAALAQFRIDGHDGRLASILIG